MCYHTQYALNLILTLSFDLIADQVKSTSYFRHKITKDLLFAPSILFFRPPSGSLTRVVYVYLQVPNPEGSSRVPQGVRLRPLQHAGAECGVPHGVGVARGVGPRRDAAAQPHGAAHLSRVSR